jgi:hypothetical protein
VKAGSLRLRLILGGAMAVLVALVVSWLAMTWLFERHIERRETDELTRVALNLVAGPVGRSGRRAGRRRRRPPIRACRRRPAASTGRCRRGGAVRSRSLWDQALKPPAAAPVETGARGSPPDRSTTASCWSSAGCDPTMPVPPCWSRWPARRRPCAQARAEFGRDLAIFLGGLWVVLSAAATVQVVLGLSPLTRIRADLARLRSSPSARMADDHPREIAPLIGAINDLAQAREADLARARRRAGDSGPQPEDTAGRPVGPEPARPGGRERPTPPTAWTAPSRPWRRRWKPSWPAPAPPRPAKRLSTPEAAPLGGGRAPGRGGRAHGRGRAADVRRRDRPALRAPVAEDVLTEMLGALIENAARFARRQVRVVGVEVEGGVRLSIDDDGPAWRRGGPKPP